MSNIHKDIAEAITLLNDRYPGWAHYVTVDALDMSDFYDDLLGQLYGSSQNGWEELGLYKNENGGCGFFLQDVSHDDKVAYQSFTNTWKDVIRKIQKLPKDETFEVKVAWTLIPLRKEAPRS